MLNTIAVNAGYKTLDEYIEAAMKQLTPEDRAAFDKMKTDLERMDKDMGISHTVFSGFFALGVVLHGIRQYLMKSLIFDHPSLTTILSQEFSPISSECSQFYLACKPL